MPKCPACNVPTYQSDLRIWGVCEECNDKRKEASGGGLLAHCPVCFASCPSDTIEKNGRCYVCQSQEQRSKESDPKQIAGDKKDPLHTLLTEPLRLAARVLKTGADKYGLYNWRFGQGIRVMTYVGAILRHLFAYIDGEDLDRESGLPHLAHIIATCCILLDAKRVGQLEDDRPKVNDDLR